MQRATSFRIAVTDVNSHIRTLIQRELTQEAYSAFCVHCEDDVHALVEHPLMCDLIILDPELFHPYGTPLLNTVLKTYCAKEIILHTYQGILAPLPERENIVLIEKNEASIVAIKNRVHSCLKKVHEKHIGH
ncbi:hypothetical protein [Desulfogranum marinum]|uniref:hypothetical protein n=1 Tax=Desulfogranum marinum TaxID=453220 RepID=UPI0029C828CF|nr:hypothetical protein [Desulfogranum marinum]